MQLNLDPNFHGDYDVTSGFGSPGFNCASSTVTSEISMPGDVR